MGIVRRSILILMYVYLALYSVSIFADKTAEKVYANTKDSIFLVYSIDKDNADNSVFGTGVAVTKNLIATNCHVAISGKSLVVEINHEKHAGNLYYTNEKNDLCIIEITDVTLQPVKIRASKDVKIGEDVFAIGNPEGQEKTISRGIISNKFTDEGIEILQTDAGIAHGSSGGGLFDMDGNLIGLTFATHEDAKNMTFALPTELITYVLVHGRSSAPIIPEPGLVSVSSSGSRELPAKSSNPNTNETLTTLGFFGNDNVSLFKWKDKCFIAIEGRNKNVPKSLAVWFPHAPDGLFIFSKLVNPKEAISYFQTMINEDSMIDYTVSKSYLYFDKTLYPLPIMKIGIIKQPVYIYVGKKDVSGVLSNMDNFLGQFYGYNYNGGMTTITFGLDGFSQAYSAYGQQCK